MKSDFDDHEPCYCLEFLVKGAGSQIRVWGTRGELYKAFERYSNKEFMPGDRITVNGYLNTADRASLSVSLDVEELAGMVFYLEN